MRFNAPQPKFGGMLESYSNIRELERRRQISDIKARLQDDIDEWDKEMERQMKCVERPREDVLNY